MRRLVVKGEWVIRAVSERQVPLRAHAVVIEGDRIADVTTAPPDDAEIIDVPGAIICPGLINIHNHTINAPILRGIVDDLPRKATGESKVYSMIMPMGGLATGFLGDPDLEDLVALGLLEVMKGGATTLLDQFRPRQRVILELARRWGLRLYGAPYLFSPANSIGDSQVADASKGSLEGQTGLDAFEALFRDFDEGASGRLRVLLGPHAADSCAPDLLRAVDRLSRERDILATIHLAQSQGEVDRVAASHGMTPSAYMQSVGLLREGVIFAHGTHLTGDELDALSVSGAAIANCASVFIRGGKAPAFERFKRHGVRTGIGTDAERMDMFAQLRSSGFASKQMFGAGDAGTAADLLHAATIGGADILRRPDLGRIAPGAKADLIVIDAMKAHLQPISDPIKTLVWYANPSDIRSAIIDGVLVMDQGCLRGVDETAIIARGRAATERLWDEARRRGHFPAEAAPAGAG